MAIITPTDRPKSVRNRCVIEVFGGVFFVVTCFLDFSVGVGAFVMGLSQIASFFSYFLKREFTCHYDNAETKYENVLLSKYTSRIKKNRDNINLSPCR